MVKRLCTNLCADVAYITADNCGVGCDYAGTVAYDANGYKKGDRVSGFVHGGAYQDVGAFAEYVVANPKLVFRIPDNVTFEQAAAYPIPYMTACLALYQKLGLKSPLAKNSSDEFVFIYGGSSAVGQQAIQLAALSGYKVITTASPKNFDLLKKLGAKECFDYNASDVVDQIKKATSNKLQYSLDCISEPKTVDLASQCLSKGGKLVLLLAKPENTREDIEIINVLAYTVTGVKIAYGPFNVPAQPQDTEFAVEWLGNLTTLLKDDKLTEVPLKKMPGGLNGLNEGFEYMSSGKVSAQKLVYKVKETKK